MTGQVLRISVPHPSSANTPVHPPEPRGVARVDDLLRSGGIEIGGRLDGENQRRAAALGELQRSLNVAPGGDGLMGARGEAETTSGTRRVDDPDALLLHRHGVRWAYPDAGQACHAQLGIDPKVHVRSARAAGGVTGKGAVTWTRRCDLSMARGDISRVPAATYAN